MSPAEDVEVDEPPDDAGEFRPVGTVVFLALYAVVLVSLWLSMYLTMLERGGTG
jgi:hypothetical protein